MIRSIWPTGEPWRPLRPVWALWCPSNATLDGELMALTVLRAQARDIAAEFNAEFEHPIAYRILPVRRLVIDTPRSA